MTAETNGGMKKGQNRAERRRQERQSRKPQTPQRRVAPQQRAPQAGQAVITERDLLTKIGVLSVENDFLRSQLIVKEEQITKLADVLSGGGDETTVEDVDDDDIVEVVNIPVDALGETGGVKDVVAEEDLEPEGDELQVTAAVEDNDPSLIDIDASKGTVTEAVEDEEAAVDVEAVKRLKASLAELTDKPQVAGAEEEPPIETPAE